MRSLWSEHRRWVLRAGAVIAVTVIAAIVLNRLGGSDGFSLSGASEAHAYLAVFAFIFGDAICPILPGETTLNAASTLAASGSLDLGAVIAAGALGAILGDSALFWIARLSRSRIQPQVEKIERNKNAAIALEYLGTSGPALIVFGRYVPGLRFLVNASMGLSGFPYRRFVFWSAISGVLWSAYTCSLAYLIAGALSGYPLASIVISGAVTTIAIALLFLRLRRSRRERLAEGSAPVSG